jgi:hypothetical protein
MARIYSYVVRYDSGFAPNPFYGLCTLATCKADIRKSAKVGDWVVGAGSNDRSVRRGGHLVYAMRVSETMPFDAYDADPRFNRKKPYRFGSRKQSCGDNIYFRTNAASAWQQRDSFHSQENGDRHAKHVDIDTRVNRVLISNDFVYWGGEGPLIPDALSDGRGRHLCKTGIGYSVFDDPDLLTRFEAWIAEVGVHGYCGAPFEWISLRGH